MWWALIILALVVGSAVLRARRLHVTTDEQEELLRRALWRALKQQGATLSLEELPEYEELEKLVLWDESVPLPLPLSAVSRRKLAYHVELAAHRHGDRRAAALLVRTSQVGGYGHRMGVRIHPIPLPRAEAAAPIGQRLAGIALLSGAEPEPLGPLSVVCSTCSTIPFLFAVFWGLEAMAVPMTLTAWGRGARRVGRRLVSSSWQGPLYQRVEAVLLQPVRPDQRVGALLAVRTRLLGLLGVARVAPVDRDRVEALGRLLGP